MQCMVTIYIIKSAIILSLEPPNGYYYGCELRVISVRVRNQARFSNYNFRGIV